MGDFLLNRLWGEVLPLQLEQMFYKKAPPCKICGRMFASANRYRLCFACRTRLQRGRLTARQRTHTCDCGRPAVTIVTIKVGEDGMYTIRMPLCEACQRLEEEMSR
jgi:hypothetical protein